MFRKDEQGNVQKELCKDYTVSDDGLTYTFTLIDDAMWSDGTPLTAHDFEYAMLRALSYGVDNAYSIKEILDYLKGSKEYNQAAIEAGSDFDCTVEDHSYVGIKATDDKTLVIELEAPCTFLPSLMCNRAWVALPQDTPQHDSLWTLARLSHFGPLCPQRNQLDREGCPHQERDLFQQGRHHHGFHHLLVHARPGCAGHEL